MNVDNPSPKTRGAIARAAALTAERRKDIARKAANVRWDADTRLPIAEYGSPDRPLRLGNVEIPCYVLNDGTRVLTQEGFLSALGRARKAKGGHGAAAVTTGEVDRLPSFLAAKNLKSFISNDLVGSTTPVKFRIPGSGKAYGYRAETLPRVCRVYLEARDAGRLLPTQEHIALKASILIRGLAEIGIIALVDEVTGYQRDRARDALATILEAFIAKELRPWVRTFPDEFYQHLFRLRGLEYPRDKVSRPKYFGHLTNEIVYRRLAPKMLDELRRVTPRTHTGRLKYKYFQRLTEELGHPRLREHLAGVITVMKLASDYQQFISMLNKTHPPFNATIELLDEDIGDTGL